MLLKVNLPHDAMSSQQKFMYDLEKKSINDVKYLQSFYLIIINK